ncbi:hypothetical protein [Microbacterium luteum]|uniref:hypothetical protein n=1 Tax=Microbacterium luteum TaxID=2782167 RepID=UPI0018890867|nr:hypothetical protein [Microbacterium luteum]
MSRIEDIVTDQADPPDRRPYECWHCEKRHHFRWQAAWCCDVISNELDGEPRPNAPGIHRGVD